MRRNNMRAINYSFLIVTLLVTCADASAQLTLRQGAAPDVQDNSSQPARFGYAKSTDTSSAALALALKYTWPTRFVGSRKNIVGLWAPYVAVGIEDDDTTKTDRKSVEIGAEATFGNIFQDANVFLISTSLGKDRDRSADTEGSYGKISALLVSKYLRHGLGYTDGKWGLFVRPRAGLHYIDTNKTADPVLVPTGTAKGAMAEISLDFFPNFSDRTRITYLGKVTRDFSTTGNRIKQTYRKHALKAEYLLYDYAAPPAAGQPRFSLIVERAKGSDPLDGQYKDVQRTGVYLGIML